MFLTLKDFLAHFPNVSMSKADFVKKFTVMYSKPLTFSQIFSLTSINGRKPIITGTNDLRYIRRDEVVEYFYEIVIRNRHKYLSLFYNSFFDFGDPRKMNWRNVDIRMKTPNTISLQKNDKSRIIVRNLFHLELLHLTRITNTCKSRVSFWETLDNMYNRLQLEDRFFAPSSIGLFLRDKIVKGVKQINYNNLFYLIQQYQPKASILNPYTIFWMLENLFKGKKLFTPVLSWGSYLIALMHSRWTEYLGVDVMPSVCQKVKFLGDYYHQLDPRQFGNKKVTVRCQPSESLLNDKTFMSKHRGYFDTVLFCPPYWTFEIYHEGEQSTTNYPDYNTWLDRYWRATVRVCHHTLKKGATFAFIINDFNDLDGNNYPLTKDMCKIAEEFFGKPKTMLYLANRVSPLRMNFKERTERLCVFSK